MAALVSVLLSLVVAPAAASAAYPASTIAYVANGDLWIGKGAIHYPLTQGAEASWPHLSPSGREVAFVHNGDIWISDITALSFGTPIKRLTTGAQAGGPAWSPDGRSLAYRTGDTHFGYLHRISADGRPESDAVTAFARMPLRETPEQEWSALQSANAVAWSPNGFFIAFPGGDCWQASDDCLTILDLRNGKQTTVAAFGGRGAQVSGYATTPAWSPDSKFLYFTEQTSSPDGDPSPTRIMEYERASGKMHQIGDDGDHSAAPLGGGQFILVSTIDGDETLVFLQASQSRTALAPGCQPNAAY